MMQFLFQSSPGLRLTKFRSTARGGRATPLQTLAKAFTVVTLLAVLASAQSGDSRDDVKMLQQNCHHSNHHRDHTHQ
jgi:hypothetical protein